MGAQSRLLNAVAEKGPKGVIVVVANWALELCDALAKLCLSLDKSG